jgi:ubiquinone/menaquinone biosynthesis C-methylase UbiE/pimeloyl-ACP methyl ester carboxylesterase
MALTSRPITAASFRDLHPNTIEDPREIRVFLQRLMRERVPLRRGTNKRVDAETALVEEINGQSMRLRTWNFDRRGAEEIFLNAKLDGRPYFFVAPSLAEVNGRGLRVGLPGVVYLAERRDRARHALAAAVPGPRRIVLEPAENTLVEGSVADFSADGLAVELPESRLLEDTGWMPLRFVDGPRCGERAYARVRHRRPAGRSGWQRVGLCVSTAPFGQVIELERRDEIARPVGSSALRRHWAVTSAALRTAAGRLAGPRAGRDGEQRVRVVEYENADGERIRAIVDSWGDTRGAPAVVIPPAWGKTKETLLPLAATLVETFRRARQPVTVIRFDGIRKRGESYTEPRCLQPGMENAAFTFSQGVRDIHATLDFLERTPEFQPSASVVVSFSGASIDTRRAVATETRGRLGGWVSVVGSADLQAMMRTISGGVDYLGGVERGVEFGFQDILGLMVDVDTSSRDALAHELAFLEDARRDFAAIEVPITWIHGRYDAWMDLGRIRHALSFGDTSRRRLIEVPTGHQLKTSREALATFQLIAREVSRMALGRELRPRLPDLVALGRRRSAERSRLPRAQVDVQEFWRRYLVGRDGNLGMELLTATSTYRDFVDDHVETLGLRDGELVVDLGSGTGSFPRQLAADDAAPRELDVVEVDYVHDALLRTRSRLAEGSPRAGLRVRYVECDLDPGGEKGGLALASGRADAVLSVLLVNYLRDPEKLLREAYRVLKPGGRLVLSGLKRDADISKICVEGVRELRSGLARDVFGAAGERVLDESIRTFMSDAARLLDLEELGLFQFWDLDELSALVRRAGFELLEARSGLGDPPQALVVGARRP